ncbi:hypothetical protein DICPUDRAFT_92233 [Dictyostelium purpureum]|uniref:Uncharacterized protein n=1 Tax=Dictyostelium purpureum TaxID=5786 RepID=F0ZNW5_DICPU|nr:uncharacterized protein DICPUDRAFT_92233 [Dictyostelium purpureum]EGC34363.1 hypothetical protein DICPUDRAFT_92233 [Dictyostelium purpureum]|eukprot:XP_003289097.1 hypothetical protein DICPUDRAFT_92233 [Dictyostelium purpureum]
MSVSKKTQPLAYFSDVENWDDIKVAVKENKTVETIVESNLKTYVTINVSEAMKQLATVGDLLKIANAASKGFPSSVPIIEILGSYQTMINDTVNTTSTFVMNCIDCIKFYKFALKFSEKNKLAKSIEIIGRAAEKAKEMALKSEELVKKAENLVKLSMDALKTATSDHVKSVDELKANEKKQAELNAAAEGLKSEIESLKGQIDEMKELADKAGKEAAEDRKMSYIVRIIGAVAEPLSQLAGPMIAAYSGAPPTGAIKKLVNGVKGDDTKEDPKDDAATKVTKKQKKLKKEKKEKEEELEKKEEEEKKLETKEKDGTITEDEKKKKKLLKEQIDDIKGAIEKLGTNIANVSNEIATEMKENAAKSQDREMEYRKLKNSYQDLQRTANATLAKNLKELQNLSKEENHLEVSIKSLEIVINTMGKVKTVFENTRLFWLQVEDHCKRLSKISAIQDMKELAEEDPDELVDFQNEIKKSGMSWLALAFVNQTAATAIISIKGNFDEVMKNLPTRDEAKKIVQECTAQLEAELEKENKIIDDTKEKLKTTPISNPLVEPVKA